MRFLDSHEDLALLLPVSSPAILVFTTGYDMRSRELRTYLLQLGLVSGFPSSMHFPSFGPFNELMLSLKVRTFNINADLHPELVEEYNVTEIPSVSFLSSDESEKAEVVVGFDREVLEARLGAFLRRMCVKQKMGLKERDLRIAQRYQSQRENAPKNARPGGQSESGEGFRLKVKGKAAIMRIAEAGVKLQEEAVKVRVGVAVPEKGKNPVLRERMAGKQRFERTGPVLRPRQREELEKQRIPEVKVLRPRKVTPFFFGLVDDHGEIDFEPEKVRRLNFQKVYGELTFKDFARVVGCRDDFENHLKHRRHSLAAACPDVSRKRVFGVLEEDIVKRLGLVSDVALENVKDAKKEGDREGQKPETKNK